MKWIENADIRGMGFDINPIAGVLYLYIVPILFLYAILRFFGG